MSHISKQQAADLLGITLECNWEQARTAYNLKVVDIHCDYLQPRTEEDEAMYADEIRPFYEALRLLFPIELSKDPKLQQMAAAVPPPAPTPPPAAKKENRAKKPSTPGGLAVVVIPLFLVMLVVAIVPKKSNSSPEPEPDVEAPTVVHTTDTVFVAKPTLYVLTKLIAVRDQPTMKGAWVTGLHYGDQVFFLEETAKPKDKITINRKTYIDRWVKVRTQSGQEGWVFGAFVHYYLKESLN